VRRAAVPGFLIPASRVGFYFGDDLVVKVDVELHDCCSLVLRVVLHVLQRTSIAKLQDLQLFFISELFSFST
jgi:hypothetical protein